MENSLFENEQQETPKRFSDLVNLHPNSWIHKVREINSFYEGYSLIDCFIVLDVNQQANLQAFVTFNNQTGLGVFTGQPKDVNYWYYRYIEQSQRDIIPFYRLVAPITIEFDITETLAWN